MIYLTTTEGADDGLRRVVSLYNSGGNKAVYLPVEAHEGGGAYGGSDGSVYPQTLADLVTPPIAEKLFLFDDEYEDRFTYIGTATSPATNKTISFYHDAEEKRVFYCINLNALWYDGMKNTNDTLSIVVLTSGNITEVLKDKIIIKTHLIADERDATSGSIATYDKEYAGMDGGNIYPNDCLLRVYCSLGDTSELISDPLTVSVAASSTGVSYGYKSINGMHVLDATIPVNF